MVNERVPGCGVRLLAVPCPVVCAPRGFSLGIETALLAWIRWPRLFFWTPGGGAARAKHLKCPFE